MKFLVTKELRGNVVLARVILILMGIFFFFLLSDIILYYYQIGLTVESISETLLGNEETFVEPLLFDVLLEKIHSGIFTSMIVLFLLSIIYMRIHTSQASYTIHLAFIAAILTPIVLLLAYFYGSIFILSWIVLFLIWHSLGMYLTLNIAWNLLKK